MVSRSWIRQWLRNAFRISRAVETERTRRARRRGFRPLLEALEDRTVLSTFNQTFTGSSALFANDQAITTFLGDSFNASTSFGSIDDVPVLGKFGATADMSIGGKAGLDLDFTGTGGSVNSSFNATLNQDFTQPGSFGQIIQFTPGNTFVTANSGSFTTTSPSFGYGASLDLGLQGSIGGSFYAFDQGGGGSFNFNGGLSLPLMSVNENDSGVVSLLGIPIVSSSPGLGLNGTLQKFIGAVENFIAGYGLYYGLSETPPAQLKLNLNSPANLQFQQDLQLQLGRPQQLGPFTLPAKLPFATNLGIDLGSITEQAPVINLTSGQLQSGGLLTSSGQSNVAQMNLQAGLLATSELGLPPVLSTIYVNLGPFNVGFTPMSFQMQPTLYAAQTVTVTPVSQLTYNFSSPVVVTLNGAPYNGGSPTSSVTFTPGKDTVGIAFEGKPITVTPTWTFQQQMHDVVNLNAGLHGLLTVGEMSAHVPGLGDVSFGPLYQKSFDFADTTLQSLFDQTTTISTQTIPLAPFTVGGGFHLSTVVNTTADNNTPGPVGPDGAPVNNSLRDAILSANALDSSAPVVIQLGTGYYNLTQLRASSLEDGSAGDLVITAPNVIIEGQGAGQTIISAEGAVGTDILELRDRLFHIENGSQVKLVGLTIFDGSADNPYDSPSTIGLGGGILQDSGTDLEIDGCAITGNAAASTSLAFTGGGGIYSSGNLTITDSTISSNSAFGPHSDSSGGGVEVVGGTALIQDSTISGNDVGGNSSSGLISDISGGGGVAVNDSTVSIIGTTISGNGAFAQVQSYGGGLFVFSQLTLSTVLLEDSTVYGNTATGPNSYHSEAGGIFNESATQRFFPDLYLVGDTVAYNTAGSNGGIISTGNPVVLKNTIIAHNDMSGVPVYSAGNNLIDNTAGVTAQHDVHFDSRDIPSASASGWDPTDLTGVDPDLGTFGNDGGPTNPFGLLPAGVLPLLPGSPAIDAGGNSFSIPSLLPQLPTTDQRGLPRPVNGSDDIGAVEYQYDLALSGGVSLSLATNQLTWSYTLSDNGPDPASGTTLTFPLPDGVSYLGATVPAGWTVTAPAVGATSGMVTFTLNSGSSLTTGQSASFTVLVQVTDPPPAAPIGTTVSIGGAPWDSDPANNQVVSTVFPEGVPFTNAVLGYFPGNPTLTPADFSATVSWGDGSSNSSGDGSGAVAVVPNPLGGFYVVGSHTYAEAGNYAASVNVQSADGLVNVTLSPNMAVTDQALNSAGTIPPPALHLTTSLASQVLYHFLDPNANLTAADFQAAAYWGDGTSNESADGSGTVQVVADPAGGFDVLGTHTYGAAVKGALYAVYVADSAGLVLVNPVLYHFTDANPLAKAADFTATVGWGDGSTDTSGITNFDVFVVANPSGGFDVVGAHAYTENLRDGTLQVTVQDAEGASTTGSGPVEVDYPLTAGALTMPAVQTEGDRVQNALLFHFTDGDPDAQATDFQPTVLWGDGTDSLANNEAYVQADPNGGFDVYGSHTYGEVPAGATFGVTVHDVYGAMTGASATFVNGVTDPPASATAATIAGPISEDSPTGTVAVVTFTDPGGAEALTDYSASISWGDQTPADTGAISYDATTGTFTVLGNHTYARAGSYSITVTIGHDQTAPATVTDQVTVADVAVSPAGSSFSLSTVYGQSTGTQAVAMFTDAGGASSLSDYQATINWGDSSSSGTIGYDTAAPFTYASNLPTGQEPGAVAVADLDGNGTLDLVVANATDDSVQVFLGNGDGTFNGPFTYSLGADSPTALAVADLGNGHLDIVTANANTNNVSVLLGNGDGTFQPAVDYTAGTNPSALALADLGNGHVDIITANRGSNCVSVFVGNGDGTFQPAVDYSTGASPDGVAIGDVNGDGKPDVVVADAGSNSVSVLLGNGDGTLNAATTFAAGSVPSAVALAHLTDSGNLDIVAPNAGGNNVSVLLGNGDGTFQAAVNYAVGTAPVALLVTDANGDGNADIITANAGDNDVSVLLGNGDGTFGAATNYALGNGATAPTALAVGDLNGAGVPDLVTANALSNNLTLLLPPFTVTGSHTYSTVSGANPYAVNVTITHGGTSASAASGTVAVTAAPLTISADSKTMTYGGTLPAITATFTGLVNGDTPAAVSGLQLATVPANSHAGRYAITATGATDSNYTITLVNGTLTIAAAPLTITADSKTMPYGGTLPALTVSYSGLVNGDTPGTFGTSPNTAPTVTTTATAASHVANGPYPITVSGASDNDYTISYVQGSLAVTPVALSITADDKSMVYGTSLPAFTASYKGFVNQEGVGNLAGTLSLTCPATQTSGPGKYTITPSGQSSTDYTITYNPGTLTITPAPLSATGVSLSATAGAPFSGAVATFTNADPYGGASSYTAIITWGDGSTSAGAISGTGNTLIVSGSHTYAGSGSDTIKVQISHKLGYTTTATTSATATVTALGVGVQGGQAAGIGFWHNKNGQALIGSFNGGGATTALGDWLATSFANLFGNLAGKTNAQVAAFYLTQFGMSSKLGAEVLATALNVYATTSSLGGKAAQAYGFKVDAYGLGASSYNVGGSGAAFGVANNTVLNVYQLLQAANARAANGMLYGGDATLIAMALNLFDGVNTAGGL